MLIYNAEIYTQDASRRIIDNGFVRFENGLITEVGEGVPVHSDEDIDAGGRTLYPGFIDIHTHLGLTTGGTGIEGEDFNEESEPVSSQLRILDGINPLDASFKQAIAAGVTCVLVSPGSMNPVAGDICAISTDGRRVDKMLLANVGIKFSLGENPKMTYMNRDESPCTRMAIAAMIREALAKARRYMEDKAEAEISEDSDMPDLDLGSEALIPLLEGRVKAHFHCHRADDIFTALRISKEFGLKAVLIHCTEGHLIADELASEGAEAVVGPIMCDACKPELANITPANAAALDRAGVKTAICTDHSEIPIEYLPISVGVCMKHGLPFDKALDAVTCTAAQIAGIDGITGAVEKGKRADLVLFDGFPFEVMSSPVLTVCGGRVHRFGEAGR
ncbi:MAG: amidohydrolase family protein [Ruminococcus sp.]|nr:amidohydrolase family protein [Ruminococcus sp.]